MSIALNGSPGKAMLPIALRKTGGNPEGRATLIAPGGAAQSRVAATCASAADATITDAPTMMQIHLTVE
jgi:hypothetical protein